ncbi:MAG: hypothetical protein GWO87_01150 [Xanthomonadaceae bacterium]|nr:hypothetical protein [Rhodospirillaceae bacterium]NIA17782.1 hypothetical protein [Xanthomonadaceae bacterium]
MKIIVNRCPLQSDILKSCKKNKHKIFFVSCNGKIIHATVKSFKMTSFSIGIIEGVADKYGNFTAECIFPDDVARIDFQEV